MMCPMSPRTLDAPTPPASDLDVTRDSDVPISTQIYWQLAYQIETGRLQPGERLAPVRELGAALRVNPNTIRAVYRRLADNGYVTSRHGAGTSVVDRLPQRRGAEALAGIVAELLRRGAAAGFSPDEVAAAAFAAASERKRPGPRVRVLFAECTNADATYDADILNDAFPELVEVEATLLDDIPDRLKLCHYDLVATSTFHGDEAQALVAGRMPVVAMLVGPGYVELMHEIASLRPGARIGLVCASERGTDNIAETLRLSGTAGVEIMAATPDAGSDLELIDRTADLVLMSREALAMGIDERIGRPERIREWKYEFDPSALEHLRRSVEHILADRSPVPPIAAPGPIELIASQG
jgi:DNA-binding transcriptional regulator YhcF (GntR family)